MNIRLSVGADRVNGKDCFIIEKEGKELFSSVFKGISRNIKEDMLECVYRCLKASKQFSSHKDVLVIEVQNRHVCEWLSGSVEYKGYEEYLDKVFDVLESLDCMYRFHFNKDTYALRQSKVRDFDKIKLGGISDLAQLEE